MSKHRFQVFVALIVVVSLLTMSVSASTSKNWNKTNTVSWEGYDTFFPNEGTLFVNYGGDEAYTQTRIDFSYTSQAAANVTNYISQDEYYTGMDIKDTGNGFHARTISTSLPNPKTDMETNTGHDFYNEADVTAQSPIAGNQNYYMSVQWYDYRGLYTSGNWYVNSELSEEGWSDYNTVTYEYCTDIAYTANSSRSLNTPVQLINPENHYNPSNIAATITFAEYMTFDELESLIDEYDIQIHQIQTRGLSEDDMRITVSTLYSDITTAQESTYLEATLNNFEVVGITDIYAYVPVDNVSSLELNEQVYMVDVAENNMQTMSIDSEDSTEFPKSLAWELEDNGLLCP